MPCHSIPGVGIVCTRERRRRCTECGGRCEVLCDWKLRGKKAGRTCNRGLCLRCAANPAPDKHLCPAHARAWAKHPKNPARSA